MVNLCVDTLRRANACAPRMPGRFFGLHCLSGFSVSEAATHRRLAVPLQACSRCVDSLHQKFRMAGEEKCGFLGAPPLDATTA
jgi:hypothetical protein